MKQRFAIAVALLLTTACNGESSAVGKAQAAAVTVGEKKQPVLDLHILVDQFGYRPNDAKVAVIRNPRNGYDAKDIYAPGKRYEVRRAADGTVVLESGISPWNSGAVQDSSGDQGWWFDFSTVSEQGHYYIYDVERERRSATFRIDAKVYNEVVKAATRMFYYQRANFAKQQPQAEACWVDGISYLGPKQDSQAHDVSDRGNEAKVRDMSGGWFDAGDTNKYVSFAVQPIHQLLDAYRENPKVFTDDFNIPESGNGIPDLLDEVKWETDWLKKMQNPDGSAMLKLGNIVLAGASPPSSDKSPRYYVPACTSATVAVAGMFAHAAQTFEQFPALAAESANLRGRAVAAWKNYQSIPSKQTDCDTGIVHAGDADLSKEDQAALAAEAAIYLFAATGESIYKDYIKAHYREMQPYRDIGWSRYKPDQGEALLFYTNLPGADAGLAKTIRADKLADVKAGHQIYGFTAGDDLYRNFLHAQQYHWGSNQPRANYGNSNRDVVTYRIDASAKTTPYETRAAETLHYFHGVNPFGMVYITNMGRYGATRSANEIFHTWFWQGSKWSNAQTSACGPAPGYVPGGPNASAAENGVPARLTPPVGQPPQKSYLDWNGNDGAAWAVTEPGIYYQAAYLKLLSSFAE